MKRLILVLVAGLIGFGFSADLKPYFRLSGGVAALHDIDVDTQGIDDIGTDTGYVLGAAAGLGFAEVPVRVEFEFFYQQYDMDHIKDNTGVVIDKGNRLSTRAFMLNGYYDFKNKSTVTPYVMSGAGVVRAKARTKNLGSDSDTLMAFQLGAGVDFKIDENVSLDLGYRFMMTAAPDFKFAGNNLDVDEIMGHRVELGIRYTF
ncbi:MAG: outer membrane beta-barrel protein [Kiritimatiellales bacterium]